MTGIPAIVKNGRRPRSKLQLTRPFFPLINESIAIIRCPYCHAITDENDKYCNNCGTQLLFPDDEAIEEEIPGEKIVDAETEEKDYEIGEPGKPSESRAEDEEGAGGEARDAEPRGEDEKEDKTLGSLIEDEETGEELEEFAEAEDTEEDRAAAAEETEPEDTAGEEESEEVILVDEIAAREVGEEERREEESREVPIPPPMRVEEEGEERDTMAVIKEESQGETAETAAPSPAPAKDAGTSTEIPKPVTFDTRELEGIGQTVDLSKARLEKLIDDKAAKEKSPEKPAEAPKPKEPTGSLPPWAHRMKGEASKLGDEESDEASPFESAKKSLLVEAAAGAEAAGRETRGGRPDAQEEEVEIFPHRKKSDSGLGYPERLTQALLPFESAEAKEESEATGGGSEEEEELVTASDMPGEAEEEEEDSGLPARPAPVMPPPAAAARTAAAKPTAWEPRPAEEEAGRAQGQADIFDEEYARAPFSFSVFAKSKAFDIFFTGFFWLVAVWIAAHSTGTTLFGLLGASGGALFIFYLVLVFLYFFLFKFFLGETIGDRLFRERPERESD